MGALTGFLSAISHRPAAGPPLPNITGGNITGFSLAMVGVGLSGNSGLQFSSAIGEMPTGANSSTYLFSLLGETVSTNSTAFVGYIEGSLGGITGALPLYLVLNGTTLGACGFGSFTSVMLPGPTVHQFSMVQDHGYWWNFLLDGAIISGGSGLGGTGSFCAGSGNGTVDLYASATALLFIPLYAWILSANVSGFVGSTVQTVSEYRTGTTWTQSISGIVVTDTSVGLAGYDQDSTIPPDQVQVGPPRTVLNSTTAVWSSGPLPSLTLDEHGVPSTLYAGQTVGLTAWVNDSSTKVGVGTATLSPTSTSGGSFLMTGSGPSAGEFHLSYAAPLTAKQDNLTLLATGPGYVGVRHTYILTIAPVHLVFSTHPPAGPLFSGATRSVPFTINASYGVPFSPAQVSVTVRGGGTATVLTIPVSSVGSYVVVLTAPMFNEPSISTVTITGSGPGVVTQSTTFSVQIEPRPLAVLGPVGGLVWAGAHLSFNLSLSTPSGALPSATSTWWNATVRNASGTDLLAAGGGASITPQDGWASLEVALPAHYVGPLWFWVNVSAPGFNQTVSSWWENVTGNLSWELQGLPAVMSGGDQVTLTLRVLGLGGIPIYGAPVVWSANFGGFGPADLPTVTGYTDVNGATSVSFVAPSVTNATTIDVSAAVQYPYYTPGQAVSSGMAAPSAGGQLGSGIDNGMAIIDILLALVVLALILAVFAESRSRHEREARSAAAATGAVAMRPWASSDPSEELGSEGKAPWPGGTSAKYVEEELGASDHPPEPAASKVDPSPKGANGSPGHEPKASTSTPSPAETSQERGPDGNTHETSGDAASGDAGDAPPGGSPAVGGPSTQSSSPSPPTAEAPSAPSTQTAGGEEKVPVSEEPKSAGSTTSGNAVSGSSSSKPVKAKRTPKTRSGGPSD